MRAIIKTKERKKIQKEKIPKGQKSISIGGRKIKRQGRNREHEGLCNQFRKENGRQHILSREHSVN